MMRVIAITQFVFLAMGAFTINVIVKVSNDPRSAPFLSAFLARYGGWLLVSPVLWMAYASICQKVEKGPFSEKGAQILGIALSVLILGGYAYAIFFQS